MQSEYNEIEYNNVFAFWFLYNNNVLKVGSLYPRNKTKLIRTETKLRSLIEIETF